jgi:7-cyano-7-deazaguanine synthase in queuosine biosynthesis
MIVQNNQQDIEFKLPTWYHKVGIKISGGADSAIVAYMLAKYVTEERNDITIIPITVNHEGKAYQEPFAKGIIKHLTDVFGTIFDEHEVGYCPEGSQYVTSQAALVQSLYKDQKINCHYVGITRNPPNEAMDIIGWNGPADDRSPGEKLRSTKNGDNTSFKPLVNIDKKGVAELYETLGVTDTLFPLTRSCEDFTDDFSKHCEECWFCKERYWGFSRYI